MSRLVAKIVHAFARDRGLPPAALARKAARNAAAYALATLALRGCTKVGTRSRCFGRPRIDARGRIVIGDDFALACTFGTVLLAAGPGGAVTIGDGVTINYGSAVAAAKLVTIGDRVMIGPYCVIEDGDDPSLEDERQARPVVIEEDVWLAGRVVVRPGVRIGAGTVVAAGSVVETDLPANALASGSPARVLRVRDAGRPPESGLRTLDIEAVEARRVAAR